MITKEKIKLGMSKGLIHFVESPNNDGVVCQIGDNWFYFGEATAEASTPAEYLSSIPLDDIVNEIYAVLKEFLIDNQEEYLYYDCYLEEHLFKKEQFRGRFLLIVTDGSSLDDYTFYDYIKDAQNAMRRAYRSCCVELGIEPAEDSEECSIGETDAYVCGTDKNYVFSIIKLTEE